MHSHHEESHNYEYDLTHMFSPLIICGKYFYCWIAIRGFSCVNFLWCSGGENYMAFFLCAVLPIGLLSYQPLLLS